MSKVLEDGRIQEEIYANTASKIIKLLLVAIILIVIGFIINFPLNEIVKNKIELAISSNRSCPIAYQGLDVKVFPPKFKAKSVTLSGRCYNTQKGIIKFEDLSFNFSSLSVYPPGLRFQLRAIQDETRLEVYPTLTFSGSKTKIKESTISTKFLNDALGENYLKGDFSLESNISSSFKDIKDAILNLKSTNLSIPARTISGLVIPNILLTQANLKAELKGNNLKIIKLSIGDNESPIIANFNGRIKLDKKNNGKSKIDLIGKMKFSETFLNDFAILNLMLTGKKDSKGFYKLKLTGTLNKLNKPQFL